MKTSVEGEHIFWSACLFIYFVPSIICWMLLVTVNTFYIGMLSLSPVKCCPTHCGLLWNSWCVQIVDILYAGEFHAWCWEVQMWLPFGFKLIPYISSLLYFSVTSIKTIGKVFSDIDHIVHMGVHGLFIIFYAYRWMYIFKYYNVLYNVLSFVLFDGCTLP